MTELSLPHPLNGPLARELSAGIAAAAAQEGWPQEALVPIDWQPGNPRRGDLATAIAFAIARRLDLPPQGVAQAIAEATPLSAGRIEAVGGYLNLTLAERWCWAQLACVIPPMPVASRATLTLLLPAMPLSLAQARLAVAASALVGLLGACEGPAELTLVHAGEPGERAAWLMALGVHFESASQAAVSTVGLTLGRSPQAGASDLFSELAGRGTLESAPSPAPPLAGRAARQGRGGGEPQSLPPSTLVASAPDWRALLADAGRDALRFALLASPAEPVRLVPSRETLEDPLYFLQYTHARACALLRLAAAEGPARALIEQPAQGRELLVALALYADRLAAAAAVRAPWRVRHTLADVAVAFHRFVAENRPADASSSSAYWALVDGTRRVLDHGLETVLGLAAPAEL